MRFCTQMNILKRYRYLSPVRQFYGELAKIIILVSGILHNIWPQKLTSKSENALFLMALHQVVLQDANKSFQYVQLGVKMH